MKDHDLERFQSELPPRYRIVHQIGAGGMATVFLAEDRKYARLVAIKVLEQNIALLLGRDRFILEIKHTAQLSHPNILPLYDSDEAAGFLFYVMPYIEGGTLRDRLTREPRLAVAEAIAITRQVAAGLEHAHSLELAHRDIKPANILLAGEHVFIADFGIARIIRQAQTTGQTEEERLTEPGLLIGTPSYMPPEQLRGASQVDGRADEYALACVLYEMLTGQPPGHDNTSPGAIRRALRTVRREVPTRVAMAIERALAADRAGRFDRVSEFAEALVPASRGFSRLPWWSALAGAALIGVLWAAWHYGPHGVTPNPLPPDTTRYAFFPFAYGDSTIPSLNEEARLADAFGRWEGLRMVSALELREEVDRQARARPLAEVARSASANLDAGRYVRGEVTSLGDSIRVVASLFDLTSGGGRLGEPATIMVGRDLAGLQAHMESIADRLLFRDATSEERAAVHATRSLAARQSLLNAGRHVQRWELPAADSAFESATRADPEFAEAALWLAVMRAWQGQEPATWQFAIERAWQGRNQLGEREQSIAEAILAQSRQDYARACPIWRELTRRYPDDVMAFYGSGRCQDDDHVVVPDPGSPSRWRFRSSKHSALQDFQRAFVLRPAILASHSSDDYRSLRKLFVASGSDYRVGGAVPPDTTSFESLPAWQGDSLVFIPYPGRSAASLQHTALASTKPAAIRHQRQRFLRVAQAWRASEPASADALVALATALELLGNPDAIDTLIRAREVATEPTAQLAIASREVWLRIKFGWPSDKPALRLTKQLADSLLERTPPRRAPVAAQAMLAGLAVLTGRAALAAEYARLPVGYRARAEAPLLIRDGAALLSFASLGGPVDSVLNLERDLLGRLDRDVEPEHRVDLRVEFLDRAATMAFPDVEFGSLRSLVAKDDILAAAIAAMLRGDSAAALDTLEHIRAYRRGLDPATFSYDALYPEAALLRQLGDTLGALAWLEPSLQALERADASILADVPNAGSFVRASLLRAELAFNVGDRAGARQWLEAVLVLCRDADPFLRARLEQLRTRVARP